MARITYPLALDVEGRRCLVVGGGRIAADKVDGLLAAGAAVVVVSPSVLPRVAALAGSGEIEYHTRPYRSGDLDGVFLAYGATDNLELNARITADARAAGVLVNAVDDPPNCDFYAVAVVRRGDLQIGISTNGHSPAFARWLREDLDSLLPQEYADLLAVLSEVRREIQESGAIPPYEYWQRAISEEVRVHLGNRDWDAAHARIRKVIGTGNGRARESASAPVRWGRHTPSRPTHAPDPETCACPQWEAGVPARWGDGA
jgi:precorrin-2 dehydrogenase/sirohydrochlorin ferrochelatase